MADLAFASFDRSRMPVVDVIARHKGDYGLDVKRLVAAASNVLAYHFGPVWGTPAAVVQSPAFVPGHWALVLCDDEASAKAAGVKDLTPDGMPLGRVYLAAARSEGEAPSAAAFRELFAMIVDPGTCMAGADKDDTLYGYDPCDPVLGQTFELDGVVMPNFVLPTWFESFRPAGSTKYDHMGNVKAAYALGSAGRAAVLAPGQATWGMRWPSGHAAKPSATSRWPRRLRQVTRGERSQGGTYYTPGAAGNMIGPV